MFLQLGSRRFDVTERPVVVGVLNRTRDSFFDRGSYYELDRLLARAEQLVADGADVLEVGARPGGVGVADVPPDEERELAAGTFAELRSRFDVPLAVDATRATVAEAAFAEGAVLGNDMSGFLDPVYLPTAAAAGAAVVATHIRRPPGVPDPDPIYVDLLGEVCQRLTELVQAAEAAGIDREHIVVDPGSTWASPGSSRCSCWPAWTTSRRSGCLFCWPSPTRSS
jgi:dihydropteroate synthase